MQNQIGQELQEFNRLYKEFDDLYHKVAAKAGLSDSAFFILYAIVDIGDGCLQKDISASYSLTKQTIHSSIQNLKTKGYITLTAGKGRDKHIHLTPEGRQLAEEKILPVMEMENSAFQDMAPEESQNLLRLNRKYLQILQEKFKPFMI